MIKVSQKKFIVGASDIKNNNIEQIIETKRCRREMDSHKLT
jgi:hypothetical protein